jgi:hypothetical protein
MTQSSQRIPAVLGSLGLRVPIANLRQKDFEALRQVPDHDVNLVRRNKIPAPEPIDLFRNIDGKYIIVPVFAQDRLHPNILASARILPPRPDIPLRQPCAEPSIQLYDYQQIVIDNIIANHYSPARLSQHQGSCVLNLNGGAGKTYIAAGLTRQLGQRTLYITHRIQIQEQVIDVYNQMGLTATSNISDTSADVKVLVINTLLNCPPEQRKELLYSYSFSVYDEVHRYCSATFSEVFWITRAKYNLAMSGTTDERKDGMDLLYHIHHGPTISAESLGIANKIYAFTCVVRRIKRLWPSEYITAPVSAGTEMKSVMGALSLLSKCHERNILNLAISRHLIEQENHSIYIMVHTRAAVETIIKLLNDNLSAPDDDARYREICTLIGGTTKDEVAIAHRSGRVIVATYQYIREGISIPHMTGLIFWDPPFNANVKQCMWRIMRPGPHEQRQRVIIDPIDQGSMFAGWAPFRLNIYSENKWQVIDD